MIYAINRKTKEHRVVDSGAGGLHLGSYPCAEGETLIETGAGGWIPWEGGKCPLPEHAMCQLKDEAYPEEDARAYRAQAVHWGPATTIIAYRPILDEPAGPEAPEWDGEGLPPVGARVRIRTAEGDQGCAEVVAHHLGGAVVWQHSDMEYRKWHADFLRPLRTPAQRVEDQAVEAMLEQNSAHQWSAEEYARELYHAIRDGKVPGVKLEDSP